MTYSRAILKVGNHEFVARNIREELPVIEQTTDGEMKPRATYTFEATATVDTRPLLDALDRQMRREFLRSEVEAAVCQVVAASLWYLCDYGGRSDDR